MLLFGFWEIKLRNLPFSWYVFYLCQVSNCRVCQYTQSNKILSVHKRVMLQPLEILTVSFLYSTDIHPGAQDRSSIQSVNLVYRNIDEQCLATTKLMLSSVAGSITTTPVLPRVWLKTHIYTLQQRPTSGNRCNNTPSHSLGRHTFKNMTVAKNVAWC